MLFDKYFPSPALETIASWLLIYLAFDNEIPAILIANKVTHGGVGFRSLTQPTLILCLIPPT
jgi:hypothetical protein